MEPQRPDRYDVSGNIEAQYVDDAGLVLRNRLGITNPHELLVREEKGLARAYESLVAEVRTNTPMTCDLIRHIHARVFGDLYEWAGRWRTVQISKPGAIWPAAQFLDQSMQGFETDVLAKFTDSGFGDDASFCEAIGEIQGEFLAIHPFREGNARTIKLMTDLMAAQSGRPFLVYDQTDRGSDRYIAAASAALIRKDYQPMVAVIRDALAEARGK